MSRRADVLVITGPTATGKTDLGVKIALELGGEVVSADSMQIYRRMSIGTAKPSPEEMCGVTHHMIDIAQPEEAYSVSRYVGQAAACVDDIISRHKLPIIVGGTGLYIDSLLSGRDFAANCDDSSMREELNARYDATGGEKMLKELAAFDPRRAEKLHPGDKKRIVRAMEVFMLTGKTITQHDLETQSLPPRYTAVKLALAYEDREILYARIDSRVDKMMLAGLENEVRDLLESGVSRSCTSMQAIGYKELAAYICGNVTLEEAVETIKRESRRYAKRQLTWLRRDKSVNWIFRDTAPEIDTDRQALTEFLSQRP